jgi:EpsI family protein
LPDHFARNRVWITAGVLALGLVCLHGLSHGEVTSLRSPLSEFPAALGNWHGQERALPKRIVDAAGVDDYLNREYLDHSGQSVEVYVGYYGTQRTGETIHSPKNCLPGAGWEPVRAGHLAIPMATASPILVNEYLIEKDGNRDLVLYWYQARGRVIASEYSGKIWLVVDAITRSRTDGALVRLFTSTRDGEDKARERAVKFAQLLYPELSKFIPE